MAYKEKDNKICCGGLITNLPMECNNDFADVNKIEECYMDLEGNVYRYCYDGIFSGYMGKGILKDNLLTITR